MEIVDQIQTAEELIINTGVNVFLTGRAGTGKTTFLRKIKELKPKRMVVLAPTGIAAINAGGSTLHSFFQLPFGLYLPGYTKKSVYKMGREKINIIRSLDLLVIDEISMVRADLLDEVSHVLQRYRYSDKPFGGVQLLMIGDLQQLAPIVKEDERAFMQQYY
ncbi:MAG: AAA family ATPase, partial [Bacteroidales bacterium]